MDVFLHFSSSFAFENAFVYKITLSSIMRSGVGFLHFPRNFLIFSILGVDWRMHNTA